MAGERVALSILPAFGASCRGSEDGRQICRLTQKFERIVDADELVERELARRGSGPRLPKRYQL